MSKNITATRKAFGSKNFAQVTLTVPDKVEEAFKEYNVQIVDYPDGKTTMFLCGSGYDVDSISFRPVGDNFSWAVKELYERL